MKNSILYVDDEIENLRSFYAVFRRTYQVTTSSDPIEALELIKNETFHLIISDQKMPGMTGVEFLTEVHRQLGQDAPKMIILSGYAKNSVISNAFDSIGLFAFVSKPWNEGELQAKIAEGIDLTLGKITTH